LLSLYFFNLGRFKCILDHEQIDRFRDFLRQEFSDETLDFWLEVEDYKSLVGCPGAGRMAKRIFSTYIAEHAPREVI